MKKTEERVDGYFTVEAALLFPFVLWILLFVLQSMILTHDRCVMEMETAQILVESSSYSEDKSQVLQHMKNLGQTLLAKRWLFMNLEEAAFEVTEGNIAAKVENTFSYMGEEKNIDCQWKVKRYQPTYWLRRRK